MIEASHAPLPSPRTPGPITTNMDGYVGLRPQRGEIIELCDDGSLLLQGRRKGD